MEEILYYGIGRLYMFLRYRNSEKRQTVLRNDYDNSYVDVGSIKLFGTLGVLLLILLGVFLVTVIWASIFR